MGVCFLGLSVVCIWVAWGDCQSVGEGSGCLIPWWRCIWINSFMFRTCILSYLLDSAVLARLGLKAPALAWPEVALASSNTRLGQSHQTWLGLGLAWPRPRLFGICISTNKFNNFFFHKLLHSKSNQFSIQKTSLTSVYTIPQTKKNSK